MALALIIVGLVVWLLFSSAVGAILMIIGLILLFVPAVPWGYSDWRNRGGPRY